MKPVLSSILSIVILLFLSCVCCLPVAAASSQPSVNAFPSSLVRAIGWHESKWNQAARGYSGEIGIMQILPSTARGINATFRTNHNLYQASGNVALGTLYLQSLWIRFHGDIAKTISAYNRGDWSVARYGIRNWPYVNSVLSLMGRV